MSCNPLLVRACPEKTCLRIACPGKATATGQPVVCALQIADFDAEAFILALAATLGVEPTSISLLVTGASINLEIEVLAGEETGAVQTALHVCPACSSSVPLIAFCIHCTCTDFGTE